MAKTNNTFRFPFDIDTRIFLGLAALFFVLSISNLHQKFFPSAGIFTIKAKIEKDVSTKINDFKSKISDEALIGKLVSHTKMNKKEFERLYEMPYHFFLYQDGKLIFWNSNLIGPPVDTFSNNTPTKFFNRNGYNVAYKCDIVYKSKKLSAIAVIPIKNENHFNSDYYADNYIVDDAKNDFGIQLSAMPVPNAIALKIQDHALYYIYRSDDYYNINDKNGWRLFFTALPLILFGVCIHTYFKVTIKKKKPILTFGLLLSTALVVRFVNFFFEFPVNFSKYSLFDSSFFATDYLNRSLGDTFINMCLLFWILLFFVVNVQGRIFDFRRLRKEHKAIFGVFVFLVMITVGVYLSNLTYEIINDSIIDFDTTIFNRLDLFSFIGLLTFMVLFANFVLAVIITNNYLNISFSGKFHKYILVAVIYVMFHFAYQPVYEICYYYIFLCFTCISFLLDLSPFKFKFDFNSYSLLIWLVIFSLGGAFFLSTLITEKEFDYRKEYAEKILRVEDMREESKITSFSENIYSDSIVVNFFKNTTANSSHELIQLISSKHIWSIFLKYNTSVHLFDTNGNNLSQFDTMQYATVLGCKALVDTSMNNERFCIRSLPSIPEKGYYADVKIKQLNSELGHVVVKLATELLDQRLGYGDFTFQDKILDRARDYHYSIAIYENGILQSKLGSFIFEEKVSVDSMVNEKSLQIQNSDDYSELWYHSENTNRVIIIIKETNQFYLFITLFAYIFLIYFLVITLYILGNIIARSNLNYARFLNLLSFNLRLRIHFAIVITVLVSFAAIGYFTSFYLISRLNQKSVLESSNLSRSIHKEIESLLMKADINTASQLDSSLQFISNVGPVKEISLRYGININIFSYPHEDLIFSTEYGPYNGGLLSNKINPLAKYSMGNDNRELYINEEHIGSFNFLASYSYLRNRNRDILAVMHLPIISANTEIRTETTSLVTTLINIYVFVFLISSLVALFISNSVSSPFKLIVKQFTQINLSKTNEPLKWNSSDEIGMLVKEYNRMLRKLENSSLLLAKNEREMAWREMAKQVAHEIKNPLTPMKLSMQMLERAIKTNNPNVTEMTTKVAKTIIEQINNLTLIATNFSNFAQLPEVKKEDIILNEVLYLVTGMYNDSEEFEFLFLIPDYTIHIFADRSQLIRVFTNIIQNAIQSIGKGEKGNISLLVSKSKDNFVRISISDNGTGISKELGKKLFQPYFTTKSSGTGLGLAMCKDIIEQFGGKIEFESIENEGTTFHIELPLLEMPEQDVV